MTDADGDTAPPATSVTAAAAARLPPPRETVYVLTIPGPTRVTIVGDRGNNGSEGGDGFGRARRVDGKGGENGETGAVEGSRGGGGRGRLGGRGRILSIVTLHAAGHNHRTCLDALEREVARDEDLGLAAAEGGVVFYHVDTPGHQEDGEDLE